MSAVPMGHPAPMDACPKCAKPHDLWRCAGHARSGEQCGNKRGKGTEHEGFGNCRFHGGCTESGIVFAEKERRRVALGFAVMMSEAGQSLYAQLHDPETPANVRRQVAVDILALGGLSVRNILLFGEAPPMPIEDRRAAIAARYEALLAGAVIDTTVGEPAGDEDEDGEDTTDD